MNTCYLGMSGSGKTYQLKHLALDYLSRGVQLYIVGRPEEWLFFSNVHLFDVYNLSKDNIDELLNASNCVIIIDSLEFIKDRSFIDDLAVRSRVKDVKLYVSAFCTDMLGDRFLTNINNLSMGYLGRGQTLNSLRRQFNLPIIDYVDRIESHDFIKLL